MTIGVGSKQTSLRQALQASTPGAFWLWALGLALALALVLALALALALVLALAVETGD